MTLFTIVVFFLFLTCLPIDLSELSESSESDESTIYYNKFL